MGPVKIQAAYLNIGDLVLTNICWIYLKI